MTELENAEQADEVSELVEKAPEEAMQRKDTIQEMMTTFNSIGVKKSSADDLVDDQDADLKKLDATAEHKDIEVE